MLCVSLLVIVLDNTILNVALPTMAHPASSGGLGASGSQLQWLVDAYTIVFAGLLLTAGSLGDRFGRYKALTFGLSVFGLGSLLSAFATDAGVLILTRSLMGVGGAFIMPSTLSVLTNVFTEPNERSTRHRHLGGSVGPRSRHRTDHRRPPARALLVGLDLPRQRSHRHRRVDRRLPARARLA